MRGAWTIAQMTFLEARRNRITWSLVFFCLVLVLTSFLFQEVTIADFDRIMRDVGLAAINFFGVMLSIFLGINVVTREIERRTVYPLLSKPLSRLQYLVGKLFGVWITVAVCLGLMLLAFVFEQVLYRARITTVMFEAFWMMMVEFLLLTSFAILASTFTSSIMAAFMSVGFYLIGHLSEDLYFFGQKSHSQAFRVLGTGIFYVMPNLERLNLKNAASMLTPVSASDLLSATAYGFAYTAAFVTLAMAIFSRRDLK